MVHVASRDPLLEFWSALEIFWQCAI